MVETAIALGIDPGPADCRLQLVAQLEDALSALTGNWPPRPASQRQIELLAELGVADVADTRRVASARIEAAINAIRLQALRTLKPRRGDRLVRTGSDPRQRHGEIVTVSSIDRRGAVWVRGAGGYPTWPQHLVRRRNT